MRPSRWFLFFFLLSCSPTKQESVESTAEKDTVSDNVPSTVNSYEPIVREEDSAMFISFIEHHENTNEYYTPVYYLADSVDETFFEDMALAHDSTIVNDDEVTRSRLNKAVAEKNFNLLGLDTIALFSKTGERLGEAKLIRVEYLDLMIEGQYTAVFKPETNLPADQVYYCVSKGSTSFEENHWTWHTVADPDFDQQLLKTFALDSQEVLAISHVRVDQLDAVYSSISVRGDRTSMLVETKNGKSIVLLQLPKDYSLAHLHPVHFSANGRPVFLSAIMPNETDGSFDELLAFDGEKYQLLPGSRAR